MWDIWDGDLYIDTVFVEEDALAYCEMGYRAVNHSA